MIPFLFRLPAVVSLWGECPAININLIQPYLSNPVGKAPRLNSAKVTEFSFGSAAQYYINNKAKPKWIALLYCS
jgi:hypothetical protein